MKVTRRNQKKVFLWCTGTFMVLILYVSYDIGGRATFPGVKKQLNDGELTIEIEEGVLESDGNLEAAEIPALVADSLNNKGDK